MTKNGLCNLGTDYIPKVERLRCLLGTRKDTDAVRAVIDAILEDSDASKIKNIPRRLLGIKPDDQNKKRRPRSSSRI